MTCKNEPEETKKILASLDRTNVSSVQSVWSHSMASTIFKGHGTFLHSMESTLFKGHYTFLGVR